MSKKLTKQITFTFEVPPSWEEHFKKYHSCYHKALAKKLYVIFRKIQQKDCYEETEPIDLSELNDKCIKELKIYYEENKLI